MIVAAGDKILAADHNDQENRILAIEGRLATTYVTANAPATSGTTELAVDQITITTVNGKQYRIVWSLNWSGTVTDDQFFLLLRFGSGTGGSQITFRTVAINRQFGTDMSALFTAGSSGPLTVTACVRRNSGTGTMTVAGSGTQPRTLTIERMS